MDDQKKAGILQNLLNIGKTLIEDGAAAAIAEVGAVIAEKIEDFDALDDVVDVIKDVLTNVPLIDAITATSGLSPCANAEQSKCGAVKAVVKHTITPNQGEKSPFQKTDSDSIGAQKTILDNFKQYEELLKEAGIVPENLRITNDPDSGDTIIEQALAFVPQQIEDLARDLGVTPETLDNAETAFNGIKKAAEFFGLFGKGKG